jgi:hypothetical protein
MSRKAILMGAFAGAAGTIMAHTAIYDAHLDLAAPVGQCADMADDLRTQGVPLKGVMVFDSNMQVTSYNSGLVNQRGEAPAPLDLCQNVSVKVNPYRKWVNDLNFALGL